MKRVVVTGGSGFIGRETIAYLRAHDFEIHRLGGTFSDDVGGRAHACDLLGEDPAPLISAIAPTYLLHLAWYAEPGRFWYARENIDWLAASLRLVRAFAAAGGERAVVAGSCAEYDWSHPLLDELATPLKPSTLYGTTKASLFEVLTAAAPVLGLSLAWGRVFFPFGPGERNGRLLGDVIDGVAAGRRIATTDGLQVRDFIHVEDAAAALVALLDSDLAGPFNIASGHPVPVRAVVTLAAELAGDASLIDWGARAKQAGEPPVMAAATERLYSTLGFRPKWTLEAGVADTVTRRLAAAAARKLTQ